MIIFGHYQLSEVSRRGKNRCPLPTSNGNYSQQLRFGCTPTWTACLRLLPYVCLSWDFSAFQPSSPEWSGFMVERADINCVYIAPYWRRDVRIAYHTRATQQGATPGQGVFHTVRANEFVVILYSETLSFTIHVNI